MLKKLLSFSALFFSLSTLICCAIPALLVTLGLGATLVSVFSMVPQLIWISEHKLLIFSIAGILLVTSAIFKYCGKQECPLDSEVAGQCASVRKVSSAIFYLSMVCFAIGVFFAFIAPLIF